MPEEESRRTTRRGDFALQIGKSLSPDIHRIARRQGNQNWNRQQRDPIHAEPAQGTFEPDYRHQQRAEAHEKARDHQPADSEKASNTRPTSNDQWLRDEYSNDGGNYYYRHASIERDCAGAQCCREPGKLFEVA